MLALYQPQTFALSGEKLLPPFKRTVNMSDSSSPRTSLSTENQHLHLDMPAMHSAHISQQRRNLTLSQIQGESLQSPSAFWQGTRSSSYPTHPLPNSVGRRTTANSPLSPLSSSPVQSLSIVARPLPDSNQSTSYSPYPQLTLSNKKKIHASRLCTIPGCDRYAQQKGVCITHGARRTRCSVEGCEKGAVRGGVCKAHGAKMKRCSVDSCRNQAVKGGLCISHGAKVKRCKIAGCGKHCQRGGLCVAHGAQTKRCAAGCGRYSMKGEYCFAHAPPGYDGYSSADQRSMNEEEKSLSPNQGSQFSSGQGVFAIRPAISFPSRSLASSGSQLGSPPSLSSPDSQHVFRKGGLTALRPLDIHLDVSSLDKWASLDKFRSSNKVSPSSSTTGQEYPRSPQDAMLFSPTAAGSLPTATKGSAQHLLPASSLLPSAAALLARDDADNSPLGLDYLTCMVSACSKFAKVDGRCLQHHLHQSSLLQRQQQQQQSTSSIINYQRYLSCAPATSHNL